MKVENLLKKLTNSVYYLPAQEGPDRPVLGYIRGLRFSVAVDAGNSSKHIELFYSALKENRLVLPSFTVLTHWHWDHTFAMHKVTGVTIASYLTNEKLKEVSSWQWDSTSMKKRVVEKKDILFCHECMEKEYPDKKNIKVVTADICFNDRLTIDMGEMNCVIQTITAPHSADSTLVYIPTEKVVFAGDAHNEDFYLADIAKERQKRKIYYEFLKKLDFCYYVSGHGMPKSKEEILRCLD